MFELASLAILLGSALLARATTQLDFSGVGNILVLNSSDWQTASPNKTVGCLDDYGKFISAANTSACGVFSRLTDYPYTLSSKAGNCTFNDNTQEKNTDSYYGTSDNAWSCLKPYEAVIYDELYTIVSLPVRGVCRC